MIPESFTDQLHVTAWTDPVIDELGHDPRSQYTEWFWLAVIGPSSVWLLRRSLPWLGSPVLLPHHRQPPSGTQHSARRGPSASRSCVMTRSPIWTPTGITTRALAAFTLPRRRVCSSTREPTAAPSAKSAASDSLGTRAAWCARRSAARSAALNSGLVA